jgi:D-arabinan exo alpha-(1,3)/(1,5)-arabinofuranosidase (non-reducing end)
MFINHHMAVYRHSMTQEIIMRIKKNHAITYLAILLALLLAPVTNAGVLEDVTKRQEGRTMRWSTGEYDTEANRDAYHVMGGETITLAELDGPGEIRHIWFTIAAADRRYPRTLVLRIYWDDSPVPSVESPIGDFFAAGNGMRIPVSTYPIEVTSYGRALNSYWRMPFRKKAKITVEHQGEGRATVFCQCNWVKLKKLPKDTFYFHAQYYQEAAPPPRFQPYPIFNCKGEGHLVGVVLSSQNIMPSWFGEADDRYYIDGELEPSLVGTGLEDYITDAWNLRTYNNLNTGVSICEPKGEDARITLYRWHLNEPVIFRKSLRVEVERRSFITLPNPETGEKITHDFKYRPDNWSSVAYWYHKGVAPRWTELAPVEKRIDPEIWIETTVMATREDKGGMRTSRGLDIRKRGNRTCNMKSMTWLENNGIGGWLEVPFTIKEDGRYSMSVFQSLKKNRGIFKVSLHGPDYEEVLDPRMDFYDPWLAREQNYPENEMYGTWNENKVGIRNLKAGDYYWRFECIGSHPLSYDAKTGRQGYNLALDGISLRKLPIDDLYAWLQQYLKDEEKLFTQRIVDARATVQQLASAIDAYETKHGRYPKSLQTLVKKRQLDAVPRDPWNQEYRYRCPGDFNPDGYDVYSLHGDRRKPTDWIGNWDVAYRKSTAHEGEDMKALKASKGVKSEVKKFSIGGRSGQYRQINFTAQNQVANFKTIREQEPGRTNAALCFLTGPSNGIIQVKISGKNHGDPIDTYSPQPGRKVVYIGARDMPRSKHTMQVKATGKNKQSSGYQAGIDALMLNWIP